MDVGAVTPFPYALRERSSSTIFLEELCGARLTYNYLRSAASPSDLPAATRNKVSTFLDHFEKILDEFNRLNHLKRDLQSSGSRPGPIPSQMAIDYCLVGRTARQRAGLRRAKALPYSSIPSSISTSPLARAKWARRATPGTASGAASRRFARSAASSARRWRRCEGSGIMGKVPRKIKVPEGTEAYSRIESARGDMQYYVVAGAGRERAPVKIRTGSFTAWASSTVLSRA